MYTRGEYRDKDGTYGVLMSHEKKETEIILVTSGEVCSAYKKTMEDSFSFLNNKAKALYDIMHTGLTGCTAKNGISVQFDLGTSVVHQFVKAKADYAIELFNGEVVGLDIKRDDNEFIKVSYDPNGSGMFPKNIPYVKLTRARVVVEDENNSEVDDNLDNVQIRTVQEIALDKEDVTWLKGKKYYIINDDKTAEQLFAYFENYKGVIAYDTETTGLRINCFGKINSSYKKQLEQYNIEHPDEQIRADRLVGIIFCVESNVSYYFPCFNRKFKNLYDTDTDERKQTVTNIRARYTVGEFGNKHSEMADYIRNTPPDQWGNDVILMERVRDILSKGHIVAHNGAFEWKVGWQYEIDTNLKDDTMLLHQIMYKFRSTTSNRGEPSNLKYLAKRELGIEQWELYDFFPDFKEQASEVRSKTTGKKKKKVKGSKIDFSYMDYEGTRIYAPTDGDVTLQLFTKYKRDLMQNHKEQEYIYSVEVVVACAIAYMEFYGYRIDENKIDAARDQTRAETACIESEIRQYVKYAKQSEIEAYNNLKEAMEKFKNADKNGTTEEREQTNKETIKCTELLNAAIEADEDNILNLGSPAQVAELFYDKLEIPFSGDKRSVAKKEIKSLLKQKNDDDSPKYPIVHLYSDFKKLSTLLTKFFDNLQYYQYPGGIVFSSFGQISTATGRMSCSKPNAQQLPKAVTSIVVPRPGYVMADADYSQIEYRVLVAMSGEEGLAKLFSDPDSDYHTLMASMMFDIPYSSVTAKQRSDSKSLNFGIPYGMGYGSLSILLSGVNNPTTRADAMEKYELYFKNQPKTRKFFDQVKEMALVNKYTKTFWSRYRYYSFTNEDGSENNSKKAMALRQAGNAVIQGCISGDVKVRTRYIGEVKISSIVDTHQQVWDGDNWVYGDILYSGKKQKCVVKFSNGQSIICSPIHKFLVKSTRGNESFVECKDLRGRINSNHPHKVVRDREYAEELGATLVVESVEITDEYIDMYDVCNTDNGYYVADGIITHNTAADIFKISVARNFMYIRENGLLGLMLIINMIHDEQLFEINVDKLNVERIIRDIGINMQFKVEGFPPLYIGAGVGRAWAKAKGEMAEIHPDLMGQIKNEAENIPIMRTDTTPLTEEDVVAYFDHKVLQFRIDKVKTYITNPENFGKDLHPAIGKLLNMQFTYGHNKEAERISDADFTQLCLSEFIEHENVEGVQANFFIAQKEQIIDIEEDEEYEDDEDDELDENSEYGDTDFALIDETSKIYGSSVHDLIRTFGCFVSTSMGVCGINLNVLNYKKKELLVEFLSDKVCDQYDNGAMEIVFLQEANILNRTGMYVNNIDGSEIETRIKEMSM